MNTEKIEKLKKGLNNSQIPESLKEKIRQQISRLEDEDKANQPVTKAEIEKIEDKIEDAVEVAEKKEEQAEAKKPSIARKPRTKKAVEPKAKTVRKPRAKKVVEPKTTTANKKSAMALAKEIRKPNEKWNEAVKRAGATMRGEVKEATKKVTSELEKLKAFVKRRKELKTIAGTNLLRDSKRKAKPRGSRTVTRSGETSNQYGTFDNKLGRKYSENRENRTDRLAPKYPKNSPYLAGGGGINLSDDKYKYDLMDIGQFSLPENVRKSDEEYYTIGKEVVEKDYDGDLDLAYNMVVRLGNKERFVGGGGVPFKPYGKTKGKFKITYMADGKKQSEIWETLEMALDNAKRYQRIGEFSKVEVFDENNKKIMADGGYNEGIEEDIDMTDDYVLRVNKGVEPKDRASMKEWMAKTNESREAMTYELGGAFMQTDLAGNTGGGTLGLSPNMPLSGVSGTYYTGLVGETGALSSGEMFAGGGSLQKGKIKNWYMKNYRTDTLGKNLDADSTFEDVWTALNNGTDVYSVFGVGDSLIRERIFTELAKIYNVDYDYIYQKWLDSDDYARGGGIRKVGNREYPLGRNWTNDHNQVNKSEEHETSYNRKRSFANGGAMMANQQIIDDASQHYVNYYLNDGASAGMFKDGGAIKNQYAGRTPKDIWNNLSIRQRMHFLQDHEEEILEDKKLRYFTDNDLVELIHTEWLELDDDVKNAFADHTSRGEYAGGGEIRRFDRHEEMDGNTRTEILDAIRNPNVSHRLENYLFGLFDGYDYSDVEDFKLEIKKLKSKDSKAYKEVVDIYKKVDKYNFKNYKDNYATGGLMHNHTEMEDSYARGGGIRTVNGREYSTGRNWTNDHRQHNKGEDYEVPMSKRR